MVLIPGSTIVLNGNIWCNCRCKFYAGNLFIVNKPNINYDLSAIISVTLEIVLKIDAKIFEKSKFKENGIFW